MPVRFLSDAELARLSSWPDEIAAKDLVTFFTLSPDDLAWLAGFNRDENRLGAAARDAARAETYHRLVPLLTPPRPRQLDGLLDVDPRSGDHPPGLGLRRGATAATSEVLKAELDKLEFLRRHGADQLGPPRSPADPAGTGIRRWGPVPRLSAPNPRAALSDQAPRVDDSIPASFSAGPSSTRCSFALLRNPDLTSGAWPETREVSNWARF
jgi:hypothetical protein